MGMAADRISRLVGRLGVFVGAVTAISCAAFVALPNKINVHITYFTAWVADTGALQIRDDVYGHDERIEQALGLHLAQG